MNVFAGARKAKPTQKHKPVIWEAMLGTVYAANPAGEVRYFDYKWDEARAFAELGPDSDLRLARPKQASPYPVRYYSGRENPRYTQWCMWAVRA